MTVKGLFGVEAKRHRSKKPLQCFTFSEKKAPFLSFFFLSRESTASSGTRRTSVRVCEHSASVKAGTGRRSGLTSEEKDFPESPCKTTAASGLRAGRQDGTEALKNLPVPNFLSHFTVRQY